MVKSWLAARSSAGLGLTMMEETMLLVEGILPMTIPLHEPP